MKLFDDPPPLLRSIPPGPKCGSCVSFARVEWHGKTYFKCRMKPMTHGAGTDIRKSDGACFQWAPAIRI
jgi:hypothetical protein